MPNDSTQFVATERQQLYRDMASTAQQMRLLVDVLDAVATSADIHEVLERVEDGIKHILPTSWQSIRLALLDEQADQIRSHELHGSGVSRYWRSVRSGCLAAGRMLKVPVEFLEGRSNGPESQHELLRAAIDARIDAIGLAPIDALALEPLIAEATALGISVVTFDSPPIAGSQSLAYIGTNNVMAGQLAGQALERLLPRGGQIGISLDSITASNGRQRIDGLRAALAGTPIEILAPIEELFDPARGMRLVQECLSEHPDLAGAFGACGGSASYWNHALEATEVPDFKMVCFDVGADTIRMLRNGIAHAVIGQREYDMGFRTVELLSRVLVEGPQHVRATLPPDHVIDTGADLITLDRTDWSICLADYLAQSSVRRRVAPGLRNALAQRERPIRMQIIGMAEQGATSVVEHREALNRTSLIGQLLAHGESLVIDPSTHTDGLVELSNTPGIRTLVGIPLTTHGETIGGLVIASNTPNACSQQDLILLESIAGAIAAAIENVRLVAQIERRARELEAVSHHQELLLRTIMEISSPAVPIAQGILVMPLIGVIDNQRATRFMENLLIEINRHHAQIVLIDISSVSMVDTSVANHLVQAAQAARLLGAQVVLVGISPAVAQTIIQLGVNLSEITTRADLASGFSYALSQVGGRIVYR